MSDDLAEAIRLLRQKCNSEIARITSEAYRKTPHGEVINPPIDMRRVNDLLKACDAVFRASDKEATP